MKECRVVRSEGGPRGREVKEDQVGSEVKYY